MTTGVATESSLETINNHENVQLEITDEGVVISLDYLSDNWDDIRSDRHEDLIALLESKLTDLQSPTCFGRHPVRYSRSTRPGIGCDIVHIIVSLMLIDKQEINTEVPELIKRLRSPDNAIAIPDDEIRELHRKAGKSLRQKKSDDNPGALRYRWRL